MQAVLPFISKAVIDVGIQTQDVSFINIVLTANLALIISITVSSAVRNRILQHMSSHKMIEQVANARELLVKGILTTICRFSRPVSTIFEPFFGRFEVTNFRKRLIINCLNILNLFELIKTLLVRTFSNLVN